jgi:phage regulatory protein, rha family
MNELVFKGENSQALTSSLLVAEKFGKEHSDVLKAIDALVSKMPENQCKGYFDDTSVEVSQPNGGVRYSRVVVMNRDGFTLLVMGFTGKKALQFKLDYIEAFNKMEAAIKEGQKKLSGAEYLLQQAQLMVEQERRLSTLEGRMNALDKEREENSRLLLAVQVSQEKLPEISTRDKIRQLVNRYAVAQNISQQDVWHKIYDQLYYLYHISVKAYKKEKRETYLDVAERNGFINKIYIIISNMGRERRSA